MAFKFDQLDDGGMSTGGSANGWPVNMAQQTSRGSLKILSIYAYTGSRSVALIYGTATIMTNTVVFYANNLAWDYYDWRASRPLIVADTRP